MISPSCQLICAAVQLIWPFHWIGYKNLPQNDLSHAKSNQSMLLIYHQKITKSSQTIPNQTKPFWDILLNKKFNSKQLLLLNFFDLDQFFKLFWWNPGKKIIKLQFWVTFSNFSQIFWPISISRTSSGFFLSSEEKKPRGHEKRYWALNVSCSGGCPQFSVDLRFFCLRGPKSPFLCPSKSPFGRKLDKNWSNGSKKKLSFFGKNLVRFFKAI